MEATTASTALVASSPEDDVEILDEENSFEDEEETTTPAMERIDVDQAQPNVSNPFFAFFSWLYRLQIWIRIFIRISNIYNDFFKI